MNIKKRIGLIYITDLPWIKSIYEIAKKKSKNCNIKLNKIQKTIIKIAIVEIQLSKNLRNLSQS